MTRFHLLVLACLAFFLACQAARGAPIVIDESKSLWSVPNQPGIFTTGKLLLCEDSSALKAVPVGTNGCGGGGFITISDTVTFDYSPSDLNTLLIFFCSDPTPGDSDLADQACSTNTITNTWSIGEVPVGSIADQPVVETVTYTPIAGQPGFGASYQITSDTLPTPEPASLLLVGAWLLGMGVKPRKLGKN